MPIEKNFGRQKGFFETPADASAKETFTMKKDELRPYCISPFPACDAVDRKGHSLDGTSLFDLASHAIKEDRQSVSSDFGRSPLDRMGQDFANEYIRPRRSVHEISAGVGIGKTLTLIGNPFEFLDPALLPHPNDVRSYWTVVLNAAAIAQ